METGSNHGQCQYYTGDSTDKINTVDTREEIRTEFGIGEGKPTWDKLQSKASYLFGRGPLLTMDVFGCVLLCLVSILKVYCKDEKKEKFPKTEPLGFKTRNFNLGRSFRSLFCKTRT